MTVPFFQVDAFTDMPFCGNPAAICLLSEPKDPDWMQKVAMEMNLSETAYLIKQEDGYSLRWFTPTTEEELCGHATLASAHVLWETNRLRKDETARFHTRSGLLTARLDGSRIELNFPSEPANDSEAPDMLLSALGVNLKYIGRNRLDFIVEVESEDIVRNIEPDFALLMKLPARGVIVTSTSKDGKFDFVSRFFAPHDGIIEDPVTGSAHCCLGPYWRKRLGKDELVAYQASKRGGVVNVKVQGDRVYLKGQAVTVLRGELLA